jgi:hypothetical protein
VRRTVPPSAEIEEQIDQLLAAGVGENPRESLSELAKLGPWPRAPPTTQAGPCSPGRSGSGIAGVGNRVVTREGSRRPCPLGA